MRVALEMYDLRRLHRPHVPRPAMRIAEAQTDATTKFWALGVTIVAVVATGCGRLGFSDQPECTRAADCYDPCASVVACEDGSCAFGPADLDADGDGHVDQACMGGSDCDDDPNGCGNACHPDAAELCDGLDNDCDPNTLDGAAEASYGAACDGPDQDQCNEGVVVCDGVVLVCDDATATSYELAGDGIDNDCDTRIDFDDPDVWQEPLCSQRAPLMIDSSGLAAAVIELPLLVRLDSSRVSYASFREGGLDLRFYELALPRRLPREIESWDDQASSYVWTQVATLSPPDALQLWMYFGCPSDTSDSTTVWAGDHRGVWHLDEATVDEAAGTPHPDSTQNGNQGTQNGNHTVVGAVGRGQSFDGDDDCIRVADDPSLDITGPITVSAWTRFDTLAGGSYQYVVAKYELGVSQRSFALYMLGDQPRFVVSANGSDQDIFVGSSRVLQTGTWYHVAATWDGTSNADALHIYVDGVEQGSAPGPSPPQMHSGTADVSIGCNVLSGASSTFAHGQIDEVMIGASRRDAEWVRALVLAHTEQLITFGATESR